MGFMSLEERIDLINGQIKELAKRKIYILDLENKGFGKYGLRHIFYDEADDEVYMAIEEVKE